MLHLEHHSKKFLSLVVLVTFFVGTLSGVFGAVVFSRLQDNSNGSVSKIFSASSDEEQSVIDVVKQTNPAVVSIVISQKVSTRVPEADIFQNFFGFPFEFQYPQNQGNATSSTEPTELRRVGGGSGFLITSDGLIVTNKHVVDDENAVYTVVMSDGKEFSGKVVALDPVLDVALIQVDSPDAKNLPTLSLGDSDQLQIGQTVIAIGYALAEFGNTVTKGVVSGIGRRVEAGDNFGQREILEEAIQTDTAINPGNSGGPLLDLSGKVIGVNTAVSQQGQLVGFAIPINTLKRTIESVQKNGRIIRPWLGVRYLPITPLVAEMNKLSVNYGVLIQSANNGQEVAVVPGSPADKAGLKENDILLDINGKKLEEKNSLAKEISAKYVGDEITLKVLSKGKEKEVKVKLEEFPTK